MAVTKLLKLAQALYPFTGGDQAVPLTFAESQILLIAERTPDGWCRGFSTGREGWLPASYVKPLSNEDLAQKAAHPTALAAVMYSPDWTAYATEDGRIYYVNTQTKGTTWEMPGVTIAPTPPSSLTAMPILENPTVTPANQPSNGPELKVVHLPKGKTLKSKKAKYVTINGLTFLENGPEQEPLNPTERSYVDHFWADDGDKSGFEVILEKHLNGKFVMKEMVDFFRERASVEEQYAKSLLKLSKSTLGDQEQGTLGKAWQSLKAELRYRSEAHSKFASQMLKEMEKPLFEFKESQKKERKEHQQIMEKSRKQVQALDASIEKARALFSGKPGKIARKGSATKDLEPPVSVRRRSSATGDDLKKIEESYNQAQRQWIDDMINACRDYERHEYKRTDFLKNHLLKYVDLCVAVDEESAESLSRVTDTIDRINKTADREYFIKVNGTGKLRPVDRVVELF